MHCEKDDKNIYDKTVDTSKEMSMQKAIAIFMETQKSEEFLIKRPDINPRKGIAKIIIAISLLCVLHIVSYVLEISPIYCLLVAIFIVILNMKKSIIWLILVYQRYAPERLRKSCVFEPTCSNYMLIAIDKYGLIKGLIKGLNRLLRCHHPNGGIDNP